MQFITPRIEVKYLTKEVRLKQPVSGVDCFDSKQKDLKAIFFHFQVFLHAFVISPYDFSEKRLLPSNSLSIASIYHQLKTDR